MAVTAQTNVSIAEVVNLLREHDDYVICGHISPDGDCIGAQLALWHALKSLGKRATCVLVRSDPLGAALDFLPGAAEMVPAADYNGVCKTFIGVDVPNRERIGLSACEILDSAQVSITIDHHAAPQRMCDYAYVDPDAAAASVLVWEIIKRLVGEPSFESALCAYTGVLTDTGGFRFQNSDSRAFETASELVACGVDPSYVATNVYQSRTLASLKLEAITINRMDVFCDNQAAMSWVDESDVLSVGADRADLEPMIDVVRSVQGIRVACMLREQDGKTRGNLRAKDETDVSALARELGGGGHKAAAGFTIDMPMREALDFMREKLTDLLS